MNCVVDECVLLIGKVIRAEVLGVEGVLRLVKDCADDSGFAFNAFDLGNVYDLLSPASFVEVFAPAVDVTEILTNEPFHSGSPIVVACDFLDPVSSPLRCAFKCFHSKRFLDEYGAAKAVEAQEVWEFAKLVFGGDGVQVELLQVFVERVVALGVAGSSGFECAGLVVDDQ